MSRRLVLHIGLEKTGSTSFQAFCADHRQAFAAAGVLYPDNPTCFLEPNHAPLAASYFSAEEAARLLIAGRRADRAEAVAALNAEIGDAALTLLSAEHLSSRFDRDRIAALREDLARYDVTVAAVVRHPLTRVLSAYATTVASGRDLALDRFIDELCRPANPYLRARETLEPWAQAFGRDNMVVVAYREGADMVEALAGVLLPSTPFAATGYWRNASPPAAQTERRRRINGLSGWRKLGERMAAVGRPREGGRLALTEAQADRIAACLADDWAWLAREYGVAFARPARPTV